MDGHQFERFCADLLLKNGFEKADVTSGSGDQGVDIVAAKDGIKYAIQCKKYKTALSNTPVQEVHAGKTFYGCHVGVVMTNSTFTSGAKSLAEATGVLLWDRIYVEKLMEKAGIQSLLPQKGKSTEAAEISINNTYGLQESALLQDSDNNFINNGNELIHDSRPRIVEERQKSINRNNVNEEMIRPKKRKGMMALMSIMLIEVLASVEAGISMKHLDMALALGGFFGILAFMFFVLASTSKYSPYVSIKRHFIKKEKFICFCVVASFAFAMIVAIVFSPLTA